MRQTISIVIPVFNERLNLRGLYSQIDLANEDPFSQYAPDEIIFVDDGSTDGSLQVIRDLADLSYEVRYLQLRRNFGKTAALAAGFEAATGDIIVTLDADLQDDPAEFPRLIAHLEESGADMVSGWRKNRAQNDPLSKTIPSALYNAVVRLLTGVPLHDFNSGYKVYRREALRGLRLYGDLHRFIPVLIAWHGFQVDELAVHHRPRLYGRSKYGPGRLLRGLIDFIMVLFLTRYLKNPLRLFGTAGVISMGTGTLITLYLAGLWFVRELGLAAGVGTIGSRPLLAVGIFALLFGLQLVATGLLGEMVRYFSFQPAQEYSIKASNVAAQQARQSGWSISEIVDLELPQLLSRIEQEPNPPDGAEIINQFKARLKDMEKSLNALSVKQLISHSMKLDTLYYTLSAGPISTKNATEVNGLLLHISKLEAEIKNRIHVVRNRMAI